MTLAELIRLKFTSGNSVPVDRITITRKEYEQFLSLKIDQSGTYKTVNYRGQDIIVPTWTSFVATTEDGVVKAFSSKPLLIEYDGTTTWATDLIPACFPDVGTVIGFTNLDEEDWRNTLEKID